MMVKGNRRAKQQEGPARDSQPDPWRPVANPPGSRALVAASAVLALMWFLWLVVLACLA